MFALPDIELILVLNNNTTRCVRRVSNKQARRNYKKNSRFVGLHMNNRIFLYFPAVSDTTRKKERNLFCACYLLILQIVE